MASDPGQVYGNSSDRFYHGTSTPVPDPTRLTTEAVTAATNQWRRDLEGLRELLETRLDAMDKAIELHANVAPELRIEFDAKLTRSFDLFQEKLAGVDERFHERDVRAAAYALAAKEALAAALQAAKELNNAQAQASRDAAEKTERRFTAQFEQMLQALNTLSATLGRQVTEQGANFAVRLDELKERVDKAEGSSRGGVDTRAALFAIMAVVVGVAGIVVAVLGLASR